MKAFWMLALSLVVLSPATLFSETPDAGWLVGVWRGAVLGTSWRNPGRTMEVLMVGQKGSAKGTWSITGAREYVAKIAVDGQRVIVVTAAETHVELTRQADGTLAGTFRLKSGVTHPVALARNSDAPDPVRLDLARRLVGRWEGDQVIRFRSMAVAADPRRTLYIDSLALKEGRWVADGRFGVPGHLVRYDMDVDQSGGRLAIRFEDRAQNTIRLNLMGDRNLVGTIEWRVTASYFAPGNPDAITLERID
jgi:hypothetical protein